MNKMGYMMSRITYIRVTYFLMCWKQFKVSMVIIPKIPAFSSKWKQEFKAIFSSEFEVSLDYKKPCSNQPANQPTTPHTLKPGILPTHLIQPSGGREHRIYVSSRLESWLGESLRLIPKHANLRTHSCQWFGHLYSHTHACTQGYTQS